MNNDDFIIVWLDEGVDRTVDYFDTRQHLQPVLQYVQIFCDRDQCIDFIASQKSNKVFLLVSSRFSKTIIPLIAEWSHVISVYIVCKQEDDWYQQHAKVAGCFIDTKHLISKLVVDIARNNQKPIVISLLQQDAIKSTRDLSKENALFMWFQLLFDILLKMDQTDSAKDELICECGSQYENDLVEQVKIADFQNTYDRAKAIWWYSRDSFLYRSLNKALRTENIEKIMKFRFIIKDIFHQLKDASSVFLEELKELEMETFSVYRGQTITSNEMQQLQQNIHGLISFNTFLSTTIDRDVATIYAGDGSGMPIIYSVLFEMIIDTNVKCEKPFANIRNLSYFHDEHEILFFIGTVFRIESIEKLTGTSIWHVKLLFCDNEDKYLVEVHDYLQKQIEETSDLFTIGSFLIRMGDLRTAETYYNRLLNETPATNVLLCALIYNQLGLLNQRKCNYRLALEQYEKALEIFSQQSTIDNSALSVVYDNIATVHDDLGDLNTALDYYNKSLDKKQLINDDLSLGITYSNIAVTYQQLGDYDNAMSKHEKSLELLARLPEYHPTLAITYGNIGSTLRSIGDNKRALEMFTKKLDIERKTLVPNHLALTSSYNNLGVIYKENGDYILALNMYQLALDVFSMALIPDHVNIALTYNNMANIYNEMADFDRALEQYMKALEMELKYYPSDHYQLSITYGNIALAYQGQKKYDDATNYHQKSLNIILKDSTVMQEELSTAYFNFGSTLKKMRSYSAALEMFEKALQIQLNRLPSDHFEFPVLYNNIGSMHLNLEHYGIALENFRKALDHCFKALPSDHNYFAQVYDNIGLVYKMADDMESAIKYFAKSIEIRCKNLPPTHPSILTLRSMLDEAETKLKEETKKLIDQ